MVAGEYGIVILCRDILKKTAKSSPKREDKIRRWNIHIEKLTESVDDTDDCPDDDDNVSGAGKGLTRSG